MKPSLTIGSPCRYWTDRPGCWQKGTVLDLDGRTVTVKPSRSDLDPVVLPRRQVKPLAVRARQRAAVAGVLAVLQERAPVVNPNLRQPTDPSEIAENCRVVYLGGQSRPAPRPPRRIVSVRYLKWIRSLPCCACGAPAQAHHYGPRPVGRVTDDPRTVPLCAVCHLQYWHHDGTLPGYATPEAARLFVLQQQVLFLQRYMTERGAAPGELELLLARAQVDALVLFFSISQRRRAA